jgi:lipoprotein-anchoring transpeptidase ErfK/SrfK
MEMNRRELVLGALAAGATVAGLVPASAATKPPGKASAWFAGTAVDNGVTFRLTNFAAVDKRWHKQMVKYKSAEPAGTIVVDTRHHFLYMIMENGTAIRYGVGVGREGFQWFGRANVDRKSLWPKWTPPPEMLKRQPDLPAFVDGGAANNPLGPRAMYLFRDGSDTGYRLHGTLEPWSIGNDVSSGCIRMFPEHVIDLYQRTPIGTATQVLPHIADRAPPADDQTNG